MENKDFILPESVYLYYSNPAVETAVDYMLDASSADIPSDLGWHEVRDYHKAFFSAQQTMVEYCLSMMELWDCTWGRATNHLGPEAFIPLGDKEYPKVCFPSPRNVFDDSFCKIIRTGQNNNEWLETYTWIQERGQISIAFCHVDSDGSYEKSEKAKSELWIPQPEDSVWCASLPNLISEKGREFDISDLKLAASEAWNCFDEWPKK